MLLLVEVLVASEHDLMHCDQLAEMLDIAACEWDREVESVDDGADRAGETLDVETGGRRGNDVVGSQLQESALPDRLRVEEAVRLFGDGDRRSADRLLETWLLDGLRGKSFASLSGGQHQRLFIALALLNDPLVVFFDELTQGLDPLARNDVWAAIRNVREGGATVVLVTHLMEEAEALCDRVAVMRAGRVVDTGCPADLIDRHARGTSVTFTPPVSFDPSSLAALPGVDRVERLGERLRVVGTNQLIAPVCARCWETTVLDRRTCASTIPTSRTR